jgi:hypothetical protein
MHELSGLILKGLACKGVKRSSSVWGAVAINGTVVANVIGLALIGRVGTKFACELSAESMEEAGEDQDEIGPKTEIILKYLGLYKFCQLDELASLNHNMSARKIAKMLETNPAFLDR